MKNLFNKIILAVASVAFLGLLTGCNPEIKNAFSISVSSVGADWVEISVDTPSSVEVAYIVQDEPLEAEAMDEFLIFISSQKETVSSSKLWRIEGLQSDRHYYLYVVAKMDADNFSKIVTAQFDTRQYGLTSPITVMETYNDGYKVHVHVPDEVRERGNALRYALSNMAVYLKTKTLYGTPDREMLLTNGDAHGRALTRDHTFVINDWNINWRDEDGNEVEDETTGETVYFHDPLVPGEPALFMVGEFCYGDSEELAGLSGWGDGYFGALWEKASAQLQAAPRTKGDAIILPELNEIDRLNTFDTSKEDNGWTGVFDRKIFIINEPEELDAELTIDVPEGGLSVVDATVNITMDDNIYGYCYSIMDMETYNAMLNLLDGRRDLLRWFMTSYLAMFELGVEIVTEDISINAGSHFVGNHLNGQSTYMICATALGNEEGTVQKYFEKEFTTKNLTLDRPIIEVTPVYQDGNQAISDPFNATFNVKYVNGDKAGKLKRCFWAADYKREWDKAKSGYESIVGSNYFFSDEDLARICSPEGCNVTFSTLDGEITRMVVYGYNEEYEYNEIDEEAEITGDCPAIADYEAPYALAKTPVESPLFTSLEGEWQISTKIRKVDEDGVQNVVDYTSLETVEISYGAPGYPDNLFDQVWPIYEKLKISRDDTESYCEEFVELSDEFGKKRVKDQNRLLCTGFVDFDYYHELERPLQGRNDKFSTFDLFKSTSYTSVDVAQIFYDFGPKWFIEVDADGSAYVPFDSKKLIPTHCWGGYVNYLAACTDKDAGYLATMDPRDDVKGFPVTVSQDGNKITIGSVRMSDIDGNGEPIYEDDRTTPRKSEYFMNIIGIKNGSPDWVTPIVGEIVLERVQSAASVAKTLRNVSAAAQTSALKPAMRVPELPERPVMKTRSNVVKLDSKIRPVEYKKVDQPNIITKEALDKAIDNCYKRYMNLNR